MDSHSLTTRRQRRDRLPFLALFVPVLLASPASGQGEPSAFTGEAGAYSHAPRGATDVPAGSTTTLHHETAGGADAYELTYVDELGSPAIRYVVDLAHPDVQAGLIRVREELVGGGNLLVDQGGVVWRSDHPMILTQPQLHLESPLTHSQASQTDLFHVSVDANDRVTLVYRETRSVPSTGPPNCTLSEFVGFKSYQYWLAGKALKIRVRAWSESNCYSPGYAGVRLGPIPDPAVEQHIPYMDSVRVAIVGGNSFVSASYDVYRSHGAELVHWPETAQVELLEGMLYAEAPGQQLHGAIDETINLIATTEIRDVFPRITQERSPYYSGLADSMHVAAGGHGPGAWSNYQFHWERLSAWGVDHLSGVLHDWRPFVANTFAPHFPSASVIGARLQDLLTASRSTFQHGPLSIHVIDLDPPVPGIVAAAHAQFRDMMRAADGAGYSLSLYLPPDAVDPHGALNGPAYPVHEPLWTPGWSLVSDAGVNERFGLLLPDANPAYSAFEDHRVQRTNQGSPEPTEGWDTSDNLPNPGDPHAKGTWNGAGHPLHVVAQEHVDDYWESILGDVGSGGLFDLYGPRALYVDAATDLPVGREIDTEDPGHAGALWEALAIDRTSTRELRSTYGGPLFGENATFRLRQFDSFLSGAWDGTRREIPLAYAGQAPDNNHDYLVVPDYELREVLPLASGHGGMGLETEHADSATIAAWKGTGESAPPIDWSNGTRWNDFLDSWWTTTVTYGHTALASSNGHIPSNFRTMEGLLREYYLITPIQAAMRRLPVTSILYDRDGTLSDLDDVLLNQGQLGAFLRTPRVQLRFGDGVEQLTVHANHSDQTWKVSADGMDFHLPENAFVVEGRDIPSDTLTLLAFSAIPGPPGGPRIDYVDYPGRWRMITRRAAGFSFRGFPDPSAGWIADLQAQGASLGVPQLVADGTIVENVGRGVAVAAFGGRWDPDDDNLGGHWSSGGVASTPLDLTTGPPQLRIEGPAGNSAPGRSVGLDAHVDWFDPTTDALVATRKVTRLADWSSATATLDAPHGVVTGGAGGQSHTVSATFAGLTATHDVHLQPGILYPDLAPTVVAAGDAVRLSGPGTGDLGYEWDFDDRTTGVGGRAPIHVFHEPGLRAVEVEVTDLFGQSATQQQVYSVASVPLHIGTANATWADDFEAPELDGWTAPSSSEAWGLVRDGAGGHYVRPRGYDSSDEYLVSEDIPSHRRIQALLVLPGAPASNSIAGVRMRVDDAAAPGSSGYAASLRVGPVPNARLSVTGEGAVTSVPISKNVLLGADRVALEVRLLSSPDRIRATVVATTGTDVSSRSTELVLTGAPGTGARVALFTESPAPGEEIGFDEVRVR